MNTEIALNTTLSSNAVANIEGFLQEEAVTSRASYGSYNSRKNQYVYGPEQTVFGGEGEHWAVNMGQWLHGYTCWKGGQPVGDVFKAVASGETIDPTTLPDHSPYAEGEGWQEYQSVEITNAETGQRIILKGGSGGFKKAMRNLASEFADHMRRTGEIAMPVVELLSDHYKHTRYGRIDTPLFKVVEWISPKKSDPNEVVGEIVRESTAKTGKRDSVLN
jgi:hypothetical protein